MADSMKFRCAVDVVLDVDQTTLPDGRIELRTVQFPHLQAHAPTRDLAVQYLRKAVQAWAQRRLEPPPADPAGPSAEQQCGQAWMLRTLAKHPDGLSLGQLKRAADREGFGGMILLTAIHDLRANGWIPLGQPYLLTDAGRAALQAAA